MDEFAQSRADDDLFDDDIIPIEPANEDAELGTTAQTVQDISVESAPQGPSAGPHHRRGGDSRGDRGRVRAGRGRGVEKSYGRQQSSGLLQSKYATAPIQQDNATAASPPTLNPHDRLMPSESDPETTSAPAIGPKDQPAPTLAAPTEPANPARPPAVRGDRTGTGGIKKPKLTEEELTAKLAAAKTRSENLSAAHARAEADAASFAERELAAAQKRVKDAANRKVMEGEREKNRARKMAVIGGREWDAEKNEEDFNTAFRGRGRGNYTRGTNGRAQADHEEVADDGLSQYYWNEDRSRGRGRGGRGGRRGRGGERGAPRGRADHWNGTARQPDITTESDFPSLPGATKPQEDEDTARRPEQNRSVSYVVSPTAGAGSWADQVEVSEAAQPAEG